MQCTSDTNYSTFSQTSQIKGVVLHKTTLISDTINKFGDSQATHTSDQWAASLGVPTTPFGLLICYNDSQNSQKCYTCDHSFTIAKSDKNEDLPKEEVQTARSRRVPNENLLCPLTVESGHVTLQTLWGVSPPRNFTQPGVQCFYWGFIILFIQQE